MKIVFKLKYPEKFLRELVVFYYTTEKLYKSKRPSEIEGPITNEILRRIFHFLNFVSYWIFWVTNWFCKIIFKIDWNDQFK